MWRLTTFGGVTLTRDGTLHVSGATQRRRLALLLLVAAGGVRGVSRDKLLAILWPDSDPEQARHALHQGLHAVRRALAAEDLFLGNATVQLNPACITSDVAELEAALAHRSFERVADLYGGPFADGFFVAGAPDFERWVEAQRIRLANTRGRWRSWQTPRQPERITRHACSGGSAS